MRKPKRKYIKRNFALYRLSGMMGNLAHMLYEFRNDPNVSDLISEAMDAVTEVGHYLKVHRDPTQRDTISINEAFLLHGLSQKLSETYTKEIQ